MKVYRERVFDEIQKEEKVHQEVDIREYGGQTVIGNIYSSNNHNKYRRLLGINSNVVSILEHNLWVAIPALNRFCSALKIPRFAKLEALNLYKKATTSFVLKGRRIENMVAACLFIAVRHFNLVYCLEDILNEAGTERDKALIRSALRFLAKNLIGKSDVSFKPLHPRDYIKRFCHKLNLDHKVEIEVGKILNDALSKGLRISGKDPRGIAAGAIRLITEEKDKRKWNEFEEISNLCQITIRRRRDEIRKILRF